MKAMVERTQVDLEARSGDGMTPLYWAAYHDDLPVVQCLCEQGANKEERNGSGWTPLHWAAADGHLPVAQYLSEQGVKESMQPKRRKKKR